MAELRIAHLYPEALNTGGDGGNVLCLERRLAWRGIDCIVERLRLDEKRSLADFDILYLGGGQEFERAAVLEKLRAGADAEIRAAVADGRVVLTTGGGFQLMGQYFETQKGDRFQYIGAADFHTIEGAERLVGNYAFALGEESGGGEIVGFENHSGRTYFGDQEGRGQWGRSPVSPANGDAGERPHCPLPLGTILKGHGNNGEDGTEGARAENLFGCYTHGPLLPKNPKFCDHLLQTALARKYGSSDLAPLEDDFETQAHDAVLAKILDGSM